MTALSMWYLPYTKVTNGMRDILQLIRKDDNDALFRIAAAGAGKVVLSKLAWVVLQPDEYAGVFESFQIPFCGCGYTSRFTILLAGTIV